MLAYKTRWTLKGPTNPLDDVLSLTRRSFLLGLATGALLTIALLLGARATTARPTGPIGDPPGPPPAPSAAPGEKPTPSTGPLPPGD